MLWQEWAYITIENVEKGIRSVKKYVYHFQTAKIYVKSEDLKWIRSDFIMKISEAKDLRSEINER